MPINAARFYAEFVTQFALESSTEGTITWLYFHKQTRMHDMGSGLKDSDWTPMIVTFLDVLAWKLGYIQLYERPIKGFRSWDRDCIWIDPGDPAHSAVTIEAENNSESALGSEVPKLLSDEASLKVLITYPPGAYGGHGSLRVWRDDYLTRLSQAIQTTAGRAKTGCAAEFLLIYGDYAFPAPVEWHFASLASDDHRWGDQWLLP